MLLSVSGLRQQMGTSLKREDTWPSLWVYMFNLIFWVESSIFLGQHCIRFHQLCVLRMDQLCVLRMALFRRLLTSESKEALITLLTFELKETKRRPLLPDSKDIPESNARVRSKHTCSKEAFALVEACGLNKLTRRKLMPSRSLDRNKHISQSKACV